MITRRPGRGPMLAASGLRKAYGAAVAVHRFDVVVPAGRIVGLVGNNGAGKTTVLKMLCGVLEPTEGTATLGGRPTTLAETRRGIGFLPEDSPLYDDQTPLQYLAFFARLYGLPAKASKERAESLLRSLRLGEEHWRKPIGNLSKGSARKVAIARSLLHAPPVLLLDEPASGLDPATRRELDGFLSDLRAQGTAILLSAHNLSQVEALCDDIVLLHAGRIVAQGTLQELRAQWGTHRYRLHATVAFAGSAAAGTLHTALLEGLGAAEKAMAQVRAAGGEVLNLESVPPALDEILRRAAEA
ncbi:MAG: type transport system ATP-binding protein [Thermoplasmata archaeon]|nr:type transport system ATP-binding protein [Thermoplasmata archaeon]